jgi:hypothetical protein
MAAAMCAYAAGATACCVPAPLRAPRARSAPQAIALSFAHLFSRHAPA